MAEQYIYPKYKDELDTNRLAVNGAIITFITRVA